MNEKLSDTNILLISIHGLIRGDNLELGRDADTGGQTKYVVELAKALGDLDAVSNVSLLTRLINDDSVSSDYAQPIEKLSQCTSIIRIPCGEDEYLPDSVVVPLDNVHEPYIFSAVGIV